MIIRLGYVAIALNLKNVTSSSTVTFATYNKLKSEEERLKKLKSVTFSNTDDLETILKYNMQNNQIFILFIQHIVFHLVPPQLPVHRIIKSLSNQ